MPRILIIDDDHELYSLLNEYLTDEDFLTEHAPLPEEGLLKATTSSFNAVILDVMLPGMNGFEVLRRLRENESTQALPILMLTARGEEVDRIVGLEMGADDYLPKPFSPRELVARLRALLRRSGKGPAAQTFSIMGDDLRISPESLSVTVHGQVQELSMQELRLLMQLTAATGQVVSREALFKEIFGHPAYPNDRSLDMLVSRLRKKIGPRADGGERIKAVRGEGYMYLKSGELPCP